MPGPVLPASFGRYTLLELVGGGGMASVYRAALSGAGGFEKELAVKVVRPELAIEPQFVEMFLDEARLSARLGHANLVHTFDFGQVDGTWFLAMEFVRGPTLAKLLRVARARGLPLGAPRTMHLAGEVARGLGFAHRLRDETGADLGLVHRDVSPQNILLSREGEVKLADFGIAKAASRSTVTRTGHVRGKCAYMAPEQARGEAIDARADVFALGVVLWECLTGQPLFDGASDGAVLLQVVQREIPPPSRFGADVPAALDDLVLRMLARNPALRPANGDEVAQELAELKLRLVRSTQETDLAAYQRELGSGTAVLDAVGQGRGAGRQQSEAVELESAAILEAESLANFDPRAETRMPQRAASAEVTRISRPATGSGERAGADQKRPAAGPDDGGPQSLPGSAGAEAAAPRRVRAGARAGLVAGLLLAAAGAWAAVHMTGGGEARPPVGAALAALDGAADAPDDPTPSEPVRGNPAGGDELDPAPNPAGPAVADGAFPAALLDDSAGEEAFPPPLLDPAGEEEGVPPLLAALAAAPLDDGATAGEFPEAVVRQALRATAVDSSGETAPAASPLGVPGAGQERTERPPTKRRRTNVQPAPATLEVTPVHRAAAVPAHAPAASAKTGLLVLTSTREGVVIATLDGREIVRMGPRSPHQFEVPVGRHEIAFRSAASDLHCRIHAYVKAGEKLSLAVQTQGVVEIVGGTASPRRCIAD